jgi:hypothetical protein
MKIKKGKESFGVKRNSWFGIILGFKIQLIAKLALKFSSVSYCVLNFF